MVDSAPLADGSLAVAVVANDARSLAAWQTLADGNVTLVSDGKVVATTASPAAAARYAAAAAKAVAAGHVIGVNGQLLGAVAARRPGRPPSSSRRDRASA